MKECQADYKKYDIVPSAAHEHCSVEWWFRDWKFRNNVLRRYNYKCAICRCEEKQILQAAHIQSVANKGNDDMENGISLCANHHLMYDRGLIEIDFDNRRLLNVSESVKNMPWYAVFVDEYNGRIESPNIMEN